MRTADERQNKARWWFDNFLVPIVNVSGKPQSDECRLILLFLLILPI